MQPIPEMSPEEFRAALDFLFNGRQLEAARWLSLSDGRVLRRWAAGSAPVSKILTILFRLLIAARIDPDTARQAAFQIIPHEAAEDGIEGDSS